MNILEELQLKKQTLIEAENDYEEFEESVEESISNDILDGVYTVQYNGKHLITLVKPYAEGSRLCYALQIGTVERNGKCDPYKITDNCGNTQGTSELFFDYVKRDIEELERSKQMDQNIEMIGAIHKEVYYEKLALALTKENKDKFDYAIISHFLYNNKPEDYNNE